MGRLINTELFPHYSQCTPGNLIYFVHSHGCKCEKMVGNIRGDKKRQHSSSAKPPQLRQIGIGAAILQVAKDSTRFFEKSEFESQVKHTYIFPNKSKRWKCAWKV